MRRKLPTLPLTRGDCLESERPCVHIQCRYSLRGETKAENAPSCALDVAASGGATLEDLGDMLGLTRERIRQIEAGALAKIAKTIRFIDDGNELHDWAMRRG